MLRFAACALSAAMLAALWPAAAQDSHRHGMPHGAPAAQSAGAADTRQSIALPVAMQEHMLANMRDHLVAVGEIVGALADGRFDAAAKVSEQRLGMSSLSLHGAAHMAPHMPPPMQDIGTSMHRVASRLAITIQDADVARSPEAMAAVHRGLNEVLSACTSCHAAYRIR